MSPEFDPDTDTRGATRQTWRKKSVRDLLAEIVDANPRANVVVWRRLFKDAGRTDDDFYDAVFDYGFDNALKALRSISPVRGSSRGSSKSWRAEGRRRTERATKRLITRIAREFKGKLLTMKQLNGKPLGECTGAECQSFGGWLTAIAREVPATETVAETLSEQEVQKIWLEHQEQ